MNPTHQLAQIAEVVNANYEREQRQFASLVAKENQLRIALNRLDNMHRSTDVPDASIARMQAIGADVIWLAWVGRSKTALNIQLAQVLAQKEHLQSAVRKAYGKVLVVRQMQDQTKADINSKLTKTQLETAVTHFLQGQ